MTSPSRDFKGIWIPSSIWLDRRLTYFERCLLAEIHSLDGQNGCFASNEYLCEFFQERERKIQEGLSKLKELGYIYQESFDGRVRVLRTRMTPENDKSLFSTPGVSNSAPLTCQNPHPSHNIDNKAYNKEQQQQHADVAVFSEEKEKLPEKPLIYHCLKKIDIPEPDKLEITERHDENTVKNALEFATANQNKIKSTFIAYLKMACSKALKIEIKPPVPKTEADVDEEYANREYVNKFIKDNWNQPTIAYHVTDRVDRVKIQNDELSYKDLNFKNLFEHYIRKLRR